MNEEMERKFLAQGDGWRQGVGLDICQGYSSADKQRTVGARIAGDKALLKLGLQGRRLEFEYLIPVSDARRLLYLCVGVKNN